ncbi:MAG: tryptophan synthase subunit alpha [Spirochaetota bacterium]
MRAQKNMLSKENGGRAVIMAHLVAYFPDRNGSIETALALMDGGASYLEVQFPFSDPTADGPAIQYACEMALKKGFTVEKGFELIREIRKISNIPIFVMGYANTVFYRSTSLFPYEAAESGAYGLIIPDLPFDSDEGLYSEGEKAGLEVVPVIAPSISESRLGLILECRSRFIYAALRVGITGTLTDIEISTIQFLKRINARGKLTLGGFGIYERKQVEKLAPHLHACVVGSAFIREIINRGNSSIYDAVKKKMGELIF